MWWVRKRGALLAQMRVRAHLPPPCVDAPARRCTCQDPANPTLACTHTRMRPCACAHALVHTPAPALPPCCAHLGNVALLHADQVVLDERQVVGLAELMHHARVVQARGQHVQQVHQQVRVLLQVEAQRAVVHLRRRDNRRAPEHVCIFAHVC